MGLVEAGAMEAKVEMASSMGLRLKVGSLMVVLTYLVSLVAAVVTTRLLLLQLVEALLVCSAFTWIYFLNH